MNETKPLSERVDAGDFEDFYTGELYKSNLVNEIATLEKRLAEAEKQPTPEEYGLEGARLDYAQEAARLFKENLEIKARQQAAIDAALHEVAEIIAASSRSRLAQEGRVDRDRYLYEQGIGLEIAEKVVYSRIGTNPLAERDARIAELEQQVNTLNKTACITVGQEVNA